jgi:hypothetical protein
MRYAVVVVLWFSAGVSALVAQRVTIAGKVSDADGKPLEHAAVLVYSAGVRKGFSIFCPTCYVDCGKRTFTDGQGKYDIAGLNPDLVFNLLVVHDGYGPKFVDKVDPQQGPAPTATLSKRISPANPSQIIRGRVVDPKGSPVRGALVEQHGAIFENGGTFGNGGWIDIIAVTDDSGNFEIAYGKPLVAAVVQISARAMAPKLATLPSGAEPKLVTVTLGATVRGRLLHDGKPVAGAEVGVTPYKSSAEDGLPEVRIGTDDDGRFAITNIPPGRVWSVYTKMESLAARGLAAQPIECATKSDGEDVNLGDIAVAAAYAVRGKVVLSDGKPIPPDMRINLLATRIPDSQSLILAPDGAFEFTGLGRGVYTLVPSVKGYQAVEPHTLELLIDKDVNNFEASLRPADSAKK